MITIYLQGGLGNQMFQIATVYNQAKKYGDIVTLNKESHTPHQGENMSKYRDKIFKFNYDNDAYKTCSNVFTQKEYSYKEIPYEQNQQLHGFFQSELFFLDYKENIISMFREGLSNYTNWDKIGYELDELRNKTGKPIVSIHVRRGDYLKFPHIHIPCSIVYYNKAMELMKNKIGNFHAYFVSDDIEWCREVFDGCGSFSEYPDEVDDMIFMVNCDHNIIANSSFSWWGAYLNNNNEKIVIGPKKWFGNNGPQDQDDIIPKKWIKI